MKAPKSMVAWLLVLGARAETITVVDHTVGTTPVRLGYNLGHFMPGTNAADWFRYSGVDAARVFISVSDSEPVDDLAPVGDGVTDEAGFFQRRGLLREQSSSAAQPLAETYVRWSYFTDRQAALATGNNRMRLNHALGTLRDRGIAILANITASPTRFPLADDTDWPARWELWQHFYAQAFLLSRDYDVGNYSMFNEPNGWTGMTEADWLSRYIICSDAIQCAVADMNSRYGRQVVPLVHAPNTANGAEKYNNPGVDTWGRTAVLNRHLRLDGTNAPDWLNLHTYNYQKYTTRANAGNGFSGYIEDYDALRAAIDADTAGGPALPISITEFNVRTGALYDTLTETQDSPADFSALGTNCIALTGRGIDSIYLFKFGQTASNSNYGIAKNGTHYVENGSGTANNYGGATRCADVFRLFAKAARGARPRLETLHSPTLAAMSTYDPDGGNYHVFVANKGGAVPLDFDFSGLPVPAGNPVVVEEVSTTSGGGIVRLDRLKDGKLASTTMPAESVWLVTVPGAPFDLSSSVAVADTRLADGASKNQADGMSAKIEVRADGSVDGRAVALVRIPVPAGDMADHHAVLLRLEAAAAGGAVPLHAFVYGIDDDSWSENTATWSGQANFLRQGVAAGNKIANNIVAGQGTAAMMLGQVAVNSTVAAPRMLDVTGFVKSRAGGHASFLIVQPHRWDVAQPELTEGDTQPAGITIGTREGGGGARLVAITRAVPGDGVVTGAVEANVRGGSFAGDDVDEAAAGYLMVKYSSGLDTSRKAYFQFNIPPGMDLEAPAELRIGFTHSFPQQIQLWGLPMDFHLDPLMSWDGAPSNDVASNSLLAPAVAIGSPVRVNPGGGLVPHVFTVPRPADFVVNGRLTLALTAVDDPGNNSGGLRVARGSAALGLVPDSWIAWQIQHFGNAWRDASLAGAPVDPDGDDISNLLEHALAGSPSMPSREILPVIGSNGRSFGFSYDPARRKLRLKVQVSDTPEGGWTDAAVSERGGAFVAVADGVQVTETQAGALRSVLIDMENNPADRWFHRLFVELLEP